MKRLDPQCRGREALLQPLSFTAIGGSTTGVDFINISQQSGFFQQKFIQSRVFLIKHVTS